MSIPRRKFLKTGIMVAALAGVPLKQAIAGQPSPVSPRKSTLPPSSSPSDALNYFNKATFVPHLNTKFRVHPSIAGTVSVTLATVEDLLASSNRQSAAGGECFSLRFTGPRTQPFKQSTCKIDHPALGTFSMFLVPISPSKGTDVIHYEAVVNRCVE